MGCLCLHPFINKNAFATLYQQQQQQQQQSLLVPRNYIVLT